jgi:hypothetical protein
MIQRHNSPRGERQFEKGTGMLSHLPWHGRP